MRIPPLVQQVLIDVSDWTPDAEFAIFPQGARAKEAYFAPAAVTDPVLVPNKRYLFKRSKRSYPDQFWGEIIAYRIGCLLGVPVPPAFYALNAGTQTPAALIEWFYTGPELFVLGGDFMKAIRPEYDREKGAMHNLEDVRVLMTALQNQGKLHPDVRWRQWWVDALLFDALIGNTDRHQDNWGLIGMPAEGQTFKFWMAPCFDNGTSLGHERFSHRVEGWSDGQVSMYVNRGTHHVKWRLAMEEPPINGHFLLLAQAIKAWHGTGDIARDRLNFHEDELLNSIADLTNFPGPVPLTNGRLNFVIRLLRTRFKLLKELLNGASSSPS